MPPGRICKLTPKLRNEIAASVADGNYVETAAALHGVSKDTIYRWLKRGARERQRLEKKPSLKPKKKEAMYRLFSDAIEKARAEAEENDLRIIGDASKTQWQAAAWRLERRNYRRWGRRQLIEHTGEDGAPIETKVNVVEMEFYGKPEKEDGEG